MKFIALIIALGFLQYRGSAAPLHRDGWFGGLRDTFDSPGLDRSLALCLALVLPVLLAVLVLQLLGDSLLGLPALLLTVLLLLYSFGRGDFDGLVDRYREYCRAGDFEAAYLYVQENLEDPGADCPSAPEELHRWMKQRILYRGFERWFAVIFWFALLGAPAALFYRLLQLYPAVPVEDDKPGLRERVLYLLEWPPSRLLVFAFAVTGDWVAMRDQLGQALRDSTHDSAEVISDAAHASLGLKTTVFAEHGDPEAMARVSDWEVQQLRALLSRSAVAWVLVLSLAVLLA